eukprot:SAG31_NODE_12760_length_918_cov_2.677656_1_plen_67_part_10
MATPVQASQAAGQGADLPKEKDELLQRFKWLGDATVVLALGLAGLRLWLALVARPSPPGLALLCVAC